MSSPNGCLLCAPQEKLKAELDAKRALAASLHSDIDSTNSEIKDNIEIARDALRNALVLSRKNEARAISSNKMSLNGYDSRGRALPGREVNARKKPDGPAARKPGDMLKDLPSLRK